MRVIVQRVQSSRVEIDGEVSGEIGQGLMVLLGIAEGDGQEQCDFLADKLVHLRIFTDEQEKMNLSRPETAVPLYEYFIDAVKRQGVKKVATGQFGADMQVYIQNDGPVTLMLDTDEIMRRGAK